MTIKTYGTFTRIHGRDSIVGDPHVPSYVADLWPTGDVSIDTPAIQNAIDDPSKAIVFLRKGTFALNRGKSISCIRFTRTTPLQIIGESQQETIVKLVSTTGPGSGGDIHMFFLDTCANITLDNFKLDGNAATHGIFPAFPNQSHGIMIYDSSNITVKNVEFYDSIMDGIYFTGQNASSSVYTEYVNVLDTRYIGCNRNGISMQRGIRRVLVDGFYANDVKNATFDTEPTGGGNSAKHITAINGVIDNPRSTAYNLSMSGYQGDPSDSIRFENVAIADGGTGVNVLHSQNGIIRNVSIGGSTAQNPVLIRGVVDDLLIEACSVIGKNNLNTIDLEGSILYPSFPGQITIKNCTITGNGTGYGIRWKDGDSLIVSGTTFIGGTRGVSFSNQAVSSATGVSISGGLFLNQTGEGIYVKAEPTRQLDSVVISTSVTGANVGCQIVDSADITTLSLNNTYINCTTDESVS